MPVKRNSVATSVDVTYISGITPGTATASKALVLDASKNISTINSLDTTTLVLGGNSLGATESAYLTSITAGQVSASKAFVADSFRNIANINQINSTYVSIGGTVLSSAEANLIHGETVGTASANKAKCVDADLAITGVGKINQTIADTTAKTGTTTAAQYGLNILGTVNTNGQYNATSIAFLNAASDAMPQAVISLDRIASNQGDLVFSTRSPTNNVSENLRAKSTGALNINTSSTNAMVNCIGSASYTDGSYQRLLNMQSTNVTPVQFEVQINSGNASTSTNAAAIGTFSNNDLGFMTNDATKMIILANGRVGIGTTGPSYILDVSGSVSTTLIQEAWGTGNCLKLQPALQSDP